MHFLKQTIELVKANKFLIADKSTESVVTPSQKDFEEFYNLIPNINPFVFVPPEVEDFSSKENIDVYKDVKYDLPFKTFSIETPTIYEMSLENNVVIKIACIIIHEESPGIFCMYMAANMGAAFAVTKFTSYFVSNILQEDGPYKTYLKMFFKSLEKAETGIEIVKENIRIKRTDGVHKHNLRRIIHVVSKKQKNTYKALSGFPIDYSHRFAVRGHWRKLDGKLGKDRVGDYSVHNFTWVSEHTRGPEDLPVINKTRVVA